MSGDTAGTDPLDALFGARHAREALPEGALTRALASVHSALAAQRARNPFERAVNTLARRLGLGRDAAPIPRNETVDPGPLAAPVSYARALVRGGQALFRRGSLQAAAGHGQFVATVSGDTVLTQDSNVVIGLHQGQTTQLYPSTRAVLTQFLQGAAGRLVEFRLGIGRALATINDPLVSGDYFSVATPGAAATARGTEFIAEALSDTESYFATLQGTIAVQMGDQQVELRAGQEVQAVQGAVLAPQPIPGFAPAPPAPRAKPPSDVRIYFSRAGDSLYTIAIRFGVSVAALVRANPALALSPQMQRGIAIIVPLRGDRR